jgi:hypothetical protein
VWFVSIVKVGGAPRAYDDGNQIALEGASIQHPVDIGDEDTTHEEPKSLLCKHNMDASNFEVPKNLTLHCFLLVKKLELMGNQTKNVKKVVIVLPNWPLHFFYL